MKDHACSPDVLAAKGFPVLCGGRLTRSALALCLAVFLAWVLHTLAAASDLTTGFDHANKLYAQGKYTDAVAAYQSLIAQQQVSAPLFFNLGNAHSKNGEIGQAIAAYRLALRLAPRDSDIRANLRFARETVEGNVSHRRVWDHLFNWLTINELTLLSAAALWSCLLIHAAAQVRRDWAPGLRPYIVGLGAMAAVLVLWLGIVLQGRLGASSAVVIASKAVVRYGPFEEAQSFYTLPDGAELKVLDEKDSWVQVSDRARRIGWLQPSAVLVLPPG